MKFFVDNNLPAKIARAFNEISTPDHEFIHIKHHPKLRPNSTDLEWIELLHKEHNWAVITKDKNIMNRPIERAAFQKAKLTGFFLDQSWSKLEFWLLLSKLALLMPKIIDLAETSPAGSCFKVPIKSKDIKKI